MPPIAPINVVQMLWWRRRRRRAARLGAQRLGLRIPMRLLRDHLDPFTCTDLQFRRRFRLDKVTARFLIGELTPFIPLDIDPRAIPTPFRVLAALSFMASGSYQNAVGADLVAAMCQSSVSRSLEAVVQAFNQPQILMRHIRFPNTPIERRLLLVRHYDFCGIPGVLGFVDGTHVALLRPGAHEEAYINRRHYHSLNVQLICDGDLIILNVNARHPGGTHDAFIWRNCAARNRMTALWRRNERCFLLGDSAYPLEPWLMTAILDAEPGTPEARYTRRHVRGRSRIECCIGVLKGRFRCLLRHRLLHYSPLKAARIVNACCVCHNICRRARLDLYDELRPDEQEIYEGEEEDMDEGEDEVVLDARGRNLLVRGREIRRHVVNALE